MGRKSNTKKIVREIVKEKEQKQNTKILKKKKSKKLLKEEAKEEAVSNVVPKKKVPKKVTKKTSKPDKKKKKIRKINKAQMLGAGLTVIMLAILASSGFLLLQKVFRPQSVARFLPNEETILTLELNSNFDHHQITKSFNLFRNHPDYTQEKFIEFIEKNSHLNYQTDLQPWVGRVAGITFSHSKTSPGEINFYLFAEMYSQEMAEEFLEKDSVKSMNYYHAYIDNYLFLSKQEAAIKELVEFQQTDAPRLNSNPKYRKISNNLPINKVVFLYLNFNGLSSEMLQNISLIPPENENISLLKLSPLLSLLDSEGFALIALDDKFVIQSFLNLDMEKIGETYITFEEKYMANLLDYVSADALGVWGGRNIEFQLKRNFDVLASGNEEVIGVFNKIFNNYTQKYFGTEISLNRDILPLLDKEFAFVIENDEDTLIFKILIELGDAGEDAKNIHNIANNFAKVGAVSEPKMIEYTLPDGTISHEIIAVPEEMVNKESSYKNHTVYEIQIGGRAQGIYYTVFDNYAVITSHMEGIENTLDLYDDPSASLKNSQQYAWLIEPILKSSDEITYFNFEGLMPRLFSNNEMPKILSTVSSFSSGKNYFNDGISTINYLHIK